MKKTNFIVSTEECNKTRSKTVTINEHESTAASLEYCVPHLKLKRVYVDVTVEFDRQGKFKGVHLKESDRVLL